MSHRTANGGLTIVATLALLLTATPRLAFSWGVEGHHIVGDVAEAALANNPAIMSKVQAIFGPGVHLRDLANCADRIRDFVRDHSPNPTLDPTCAPFVAKFAAPGDLPSRFPHSDKWHFIDIPVDGKQHSLADIPSFCDPNGCAPKMIEQYRDALTPGASSAVQAEAILFLTHLVGDIHQPLHSAERNNDAGGNAVIVKFFGQGPFALHHVWDDEIINHMTNAQGNPLTDPTSRSQFVASGLPQPGTANPWQWGLDANAQAVSTVYVDNGRKLPDKRNPPGVTLHSATYQAAANPVVVSQLRLAGVRLATLLSDRLSSPGH